jgi:NADH-quinone oxidoreductase subunit K
MTIALGHYLILAVFLFTVGVIGALTRKSAIIVFLSIELMLNAANVVFMAMGRYFGQLDGAVFVLFILAVSAAEAAVGVAIVVAFIRRRGTTDIDAANLMKW